MFTPTYSIPWSVRLLAAWRVVRGKPASASADMARILAAAPVRPRVEGTENIPSAGPLLITQNHYCRRGLGPWWGTSLIFTAIARRRGVDPAWMVTSEWYYLDRLRSSTQSLAIEIAPKEPTAGCRPTSTRYASDASMQMDARRGSAP